MTTKAQGDRGEVAVADYLRRKNWVILSRQWRCRFGELDLVARDPGGIVCFVEVKLRSAGSWGLPREAVNFRKQAHLRSAAGAYLSTFEIDDPARFDVAEVYETADGTLRVEYLEDAFS